MIRLAFANSKFINRPENWRNYGISKNEIRKLAAFSLFQLSINQANSDFVTFQIANVQLLTSDIKSLIIDRIHFESSRNLSI